MRAHRASRPPAEPKLDAAMLEELVAEGMLIVGAAIRLAVSNQAIMRTLRDHSDFDREWYSAAVREQLELLVEEKRSDARRVEDELARATGRSGRAKHQSDYRQVDVKQLRRRKSVIDALAAEIGAREADARYVDELAAASQDAATREIGTAIRAAALRLAPRADLLTPEERRTQLLALRAELAREVGGRAASV